MPAAPADANCFQTIRFFKYSDILDCRSQTWIFSYQSRGAFVCIIEGEEVEPLCKDKLAHFSLKSLQLQIYTAIMLCFPFTVTVWLLTLRLAVNRYWWSSSQMHSHMQTSVGKFPYYAVALRWRKKQCECWILLTALYECKHLCTSFANAGHLDQMCASL